MAVEHQTPQLVMRRPNLDHLPPLDLPEGYVARHYQEGDREAWTRIIADSFATVMAPDAFEQRFNGGVFRPEQIWFVAAGDVPVATAAAWVVPRWGEQRGMLHMVGALSTHRGRRLGLLVSLAALYQMAREGRTEAVLQTDDFRLPAVRTYLTLGFEPCLIHDNQRARWRAVLPQVGVDDVETRFGTILDGPLVPVD